MISGSIGPFVIASQQVRPGVAAPMTSSAKQSRSEQKNWIAMPWSVALWFILLSCLPKFANLIVNMPRP
jgi:hypothetical protein